ncbi:NAD-dependent epimerase/dehydratase family protein [Paraburkholderia sp. J8-2]|uniref:NAD-dependent epimerase/dehydratase family protein n=1 Tax=Paraburkholderia sp. J8-2 TaxID=2805440 RepID=UPI002AB7EAB4|nr:NAD-dependent epimerase/dehydratase family protein [Paraburkholderia sp. J8-2]
MKILITGSSGFTGRALVQRLRSRQCPPELANAELVLLDVSRPGYETDNGCRVIVGSLGEEQTINSAFDAPLDIVFHLASVPGGMAEQHYELGRAANLDGMVRLLEAARGGNNRPRFVFASSVAALGGPLESTVDDETPLRPQMSYGAQKQIGEILVRDYSRREWIDGISLRLSGIVARPRVKTGQLSAFMSDIMHALAANESYVCPVSRQAIMWWMSVPRLVDNLLLAATMSMSDEDVGRAMTLPALWLSIEQIADALADEYGVDAGALLSYSPDAALEARFGRYPDLRTPTAERLGFLHDGSARALVRRALSAETVPGR